MSRRIYPSWDPAYADRLSLEFRLRLDRKVGTLSKGENRRLQFLSEQCRHDELPGARVQHSSATVTRPDLLGRLHPFEADRHRLVGVRRVHSDRTADERRRRRQSQSGAGP